MEENIMLIQETFGAPKIIAPNEAHLACVLLLDTSGSMTGQPIDSLNNALHTFKEKVAMDDLASRRVDIAIVEFNNDARIVQDFTPVAQMDPVTLRATGMTYMGAGIDLAIDMVKQRNQFYNSVGTPVFRPWIFMITDGSPTDDIESAARRIREEEAKGTHGKLKFFALGVGKYDRATLLKLTNRVIELTDTDFDGIFNWMSESMVAISVSRVGEEVKLGDLPENARVVPADW
jgi:uncharacterized protein YegL